MAADAEGGGVMKVILYHHTLHSALSIHYLLLIMGSFQISAYNCIIVAFYHSFFFTTITTILIYGTAAITAELYPNPVGHDTTNKSVLIEHSEHYIVLHTEIGVVLYP